MGYQSIQAITLKTKKSIQATLYNQSQVVIHPNKINKGIHKKILIIDNVVCDIYEYECMTSHD